MLMLLMFIQEQAPPSGWQQLIALLAPLLICFIIFWFMLIRPQRREQKKKQEMIASLKKDDHVWISPGIYGVIDKVRGEYLVLKVDEKNDVKIRVLTSAVIAVDKKGTSLEKETENTGTKK